MRFATPVSAVLFSLIFTDSLLAQQTTTSTVQRDPQAIVLLQQSLNAAGGASAIAAIRDYAGSGTITYFWAGKEVRGEVQVYSKGIAQFRLDATLPDGVRSWAISNQAGSVRETTGYTHEIPFHNAIDFGGLTLPYSLMSAALNDPSSTIQYVGPAVKNGRNAYQVRVQSIPIDFEPSGLLRHLSTKDIFIDTNTFQVLSTLDMVHPDQDFYQEIPHEIAFSDYRAVNGVLLPFTFQETVASQHTWTIFLNSINVNSGLSDAKFQL